MLAHDYNFATQLKIGKEAEYHLDAYFSQWYTIEEVPPEVERVVKADRLFITSDGKQRLVEYKTDYMCHKTGNLIVETVSVDKDNTPGWVISSLADLLVWWITGNGEVLAIQMDAMRNALPEWNRKYRKVQIPNEAYNTVGILVPLYEIEDISVWREELSL